MKRLIIHTTLTTLMMAGSMSAMATQKNWTFTPADADVVIQAKKLGFSNIDINFSNFIGNIIFDPSKPNQTKITLDIDTKNFDSGSGVQNDLLAGKSWFDVARYPSMRFVSNSVNFTSDTNATLKGNVTLRGITKPKTLKLSLFNVKKDGAGNITSMNFKVTGIAARADFGMTALKGIVNDHVNISVSGKLN